MEGNSCKELKEKQKTMAFYGLLGVDSNASQAEIRRAYRRLALRYHPDKQQNNMEMFQRIHRAYQVLNDPAQRLQYDEKLRQMLATSHLFFSLKNPQIIFVYQEGKENLQMMEQMVTCRQAFLRKLKFVQKTPQIEFMKWITNTLKW